jgi:hypothetical protein
MKEPIEFTSVNLSKVRRNLVIHEPYFRKLTIMATETHRGIGDMMEYLIDQNFISRLMSNEPDDAAETAQEDKG